MLPAWIRPPRCCASGRLPTSREARCVALSPPASRSGIGCPRRWSSTSRRIASIWRRRMRGDPLSRLLIIGRLAAEAKRRLTPLQLARLLRSAAAAKKAWDPVVIDVRDRTSVADYFVICEGETDRQVRAIADGMVQAAKERDRRPLAVGGYDDPGQDLLHLPPVLGPGLFPCGPSYLGLAEP